MVHVRAILGFLLMFPAFAIAQQVRDEMDVIDGSNPSLRYGFYTEPSGQVMMGRYYFIDDGQALRVSLAPFGKTATELPVQTYDRGQGKLELGWEGKPGRVCRLSQHSASLFLGNCIENQAVMPMAIRVVNEHDVEWQGTHFPVSATDIAIVEKAKSIFVEQGLRNQHGDRNCDDDIALGRFSVFCALYLASLEIDGVYRHRRPAIQYVRDELSNRFPGEYVHLLRDINNNPDIPDAMLAEAFDSASLRLISESDSQDAFFQQIAGLCGSRFTGQASFPEDPGDAWRGKNLVAFIETCDADEIRIPFSVGEDHSRTWILRRVEGGLQLQHDHRHADGTPDEVTLYGGTTLSAGSHLVQSFPADAYTADLIPEAATNEWFLSLSEDGTELTYYLERHAQPRFRAVLYKGSE